MRHKRTIVSVSMLFLLAAIAVFLAPQTATGSSCVGNCGWTACAYIPTGQASSGACTAFGSCNWQPVETFTSPCQNSPCSCQEPTGGTNVKYVNNYYDCPFN